METTFWQRWHNRRDLIENPELHDCTGWILQQCRNTRPRMASREALISHILLGVVEFGLCIDIHDSKCNDIMQIASKIR